MPALRQGVEVVGLGDFRKQLKELGDKAWLKELGGINNEVAQLIVDGAKTRALSLGSTPAHAVQTGGLKASKAASAAMVILGGSGVPFAIGAEFGSDKWHQFKPWTGAGADAGHFLYPEIRAERDRIGELYLDRMVGFAAKAFPN